MLFKGSMVALVTPFKNDGSLDEKAFENLINWHIDAKTDAIVLSGTTGESPTLSEREKLRIFELALQFAKGKTKIIAGTGTYSTQRTKELTKKAKKIGVDGLLVVVPYYNKPPIGGLVKHYEEIAKANVPIILYHHPGRTGTKLDLASFKQLEDIEQIVAVKEASGDLNFACNLIKNTRFDVLSGDDPLTIEMIEKGAKGVISVVANIIPNEWKSINDFCLNKEYEKAKEIYRKIEPLVNAMFLETNPLCVKYSLSLMKKCSSFMRLPLINPVAKNCEIIKHVLKKTKIL